MLLQRHVEKIGKCCMRLRLQLVTIADGVGRRSPDATALFTCSAALTTAGTSSATGRALVAVGGADDAGHGGFFVRRQGCSQGPLLTSASRTSPTMRPRICTAFPAMTAETKPKDPS